MAELAMIDVLVTVEIFIFMLFSYSCLSSSSPMEKKVHDYEVKSGLHYN